MGKHNHQCVKCDSHEEKTRITERVWEALCRKRTKQPVALAVLFVLMFIGGCFFVKANQAKEFEKNDYGVFLNADASSLERFKMYETIVIDAQYFTKRDIELLHQNGTVVYTYLNIGSIENFREYYTTYAELAIGEYEHWEEEEWVDVANPDWQKFIGQLSQELYEKGVDGFFIDNCDVYYYDPHESIFEGITAILQNIMTFGKAVIINGGDTYVAEYRERYGAIDQIMTGVNQESVLILIAELFVNKRARREIISANIWKRARRMGWKCICWNIQLIKN